VESKRKFPDLTAAAERAIVRLRAYTNQKDEPLSSTASAEKKSKRLFNALTNQLGALAGRSDPQPPTPSAAAVPAGTPTEPCMMYT
jgi:hypothetical protein